jgi:hypothetical protein
MYYKNTFNKLWNEFEKLPDVDWYEYTDDMVKQWFPNYFTLQDMSASSEPQPTDMQNYLDSLADLLSFNYDVSDYQNYYDNWNQEMDTIYSLCLEKLADTDRDMLITGQQEWLAARSQKEQETSGLVDQGLLLGDMTKQRTYRLISFYFDDHFYD